jgi:hypothetical protein
VKSRNVTITIDEELARWARVRAAEMDMSLSAMIADMLRERMSGATEYQRAMEEFFTFEPTVIRKKGRRLPARHEVYGRQVLR